MTDSDALRLKTLALQIAGQLPQDRCEIEIVLGLVADLTDWRGYEPAGEETDPACPGES